MDAKLAAKEEWPDGNDPSDNGGISPLKLFTSS